MRFAAVGCPTGTHAVPLRFSAWPLVRARRKGPVALERLQIREVREGRERTLVDVLGARTAGPLARGRFARPEP